MSDFRFIHYSVMLPGESEEAAWDEYTDHVWHMTWKYTDMDESSRRSGPPPAPPEMTEEDRAKLQSRTTFAGTPDEIVRSLTDLRERAGVPVDFVARSYFPTLAYERQVELMATLANEVAPAL